MVARSTVHSREPSYLLLQDASFWLSSYKLGLSQQRRSATYAALDQMGEHVTTYK